MTKDEYIAWNICEGHIIVDAENGKVYATRGPGGIMLQEPRELKGSNLNGYLAVSIRNGETKRLCRIHRVVWIAKHGIIPEGYVVDHINSNKHDNRISNLQLLTAAENSTKAAHDGLYRSGSDNPATRIPDEVHDLIRYVYGNTDLTIRQLSEVFGISKSRVHQIIHEQGWTDIGDWTDSKGKLHKGENNDNARYKALGNSIALPSWLWVLMRLSVGCGADTTMGSLFDGIGGFPLIWEYLNGRGSCLWASEIEEFAIAVTKKHFPEE